MEQNTHPLRRFIAVVGPTASGKSEVALSLAASIGGEIVCCDSVQLYRGFDIGSAKPSREDQLRAPHHLFDRFQWFEECDASVYAQEANAAISDILRRGRVPIVTGGTGLYLRALAGENWDEGLPKDPALRTRLKERTSDDLYRELEGLDPVRARSVHPNDRFRVIRALEINIMTGAPVPQPKETGTSRDYVSIVLSPPRDQLSERIALRVGAMLKAGLVHEVKSLLDSGVEPSCKPMQSIGYKQCIDFLSGNIGAEHLADAITLATRQYSKRQMTWFQKLDRDFTLMSAEDIGGVSAFLGLCRFGVQ